MKFILLPLGLFSLMSMGDPMFLPTPKQPGLIPEVQSTTSNLNQIHRDPAEKRTLQQQEEKPQDLQPIQQRMEPRPSPSKKIK